MIAYRLTGSRCRCQACGALFNSVSVFDRHRVGPWRDHGVYRRCLNSDEMIRRGWCVSAVGFWIERRRLDRTPRGGNQPPPAPSPRAPAVGATSHAVA